MFHNLLRLTGKTNINNSSVVNQSINCIFIIIFFLEGCRGKRGFSQAALPYLLYSSLYAPSDSKYFFGLSFGGHRFPHGIGVGVRFKSGSKRCVRERECVCGCKCVCV